NDRRHPAAGHNGGQARAGREGVRPDGGGLAAGVGPAGGGRGAEPGPGARADRRGLPGGRRRRRHRWWKPATGRESARDTAARAATPAGGRREADHGGRDPLRLLTNWDVPGRRAAALTMATRTGPVRRPTA